MGGESTRERVKVKDLHSRWVWEERVHPPQEPKPPYTGFRGGNRTGSPNVLERTGGGWVYAPRLLTHRFRLRVHFVKDTFLI